MPKVRPTVEIVRDAQKHLTVAKSRLFRSGNSQDIISLINDAANMIDKVIARIPQEGDSSYEEKQIDNALALIEKEQKKPTPKIDYVGAIRAIHSSNSLKDAVAAGKQHNLNNDQIGLIIKKAKSHSNLGKAIRAKQSIPAQAPIIPPIITIPEDDDDTIVSEPIPDDMKQLLGSE